MIMGKNGFVRNLSFRHLGHKNVNITLVSFCHMFKSKRILNVLMSGAVNN